MSNSKSNSTNTQSQEVRTTTYNIDDLVDDLIADALRDDDGLRNDKLR